MSRVQARDFYEIHQDKSFYEDLVKFMTSGPVVVQVLEGEDAITRYRDVMGATTFGERLTGNDTFKIRNLDQAEMRYMVRTVRKMPNEK